MCSPASITYRSGLYLINFVSIKYFRDTKFKLAQRINKLYLGRW